MKKFLAAVLAVVMLLALGTVAFAAGSPAADEGGQTVVPVVTPKPTETPEEEEEPVVTPDAPEVADADTTAEEAVEAVDAETPVIVLATATGFEAVVEDEETTVPVEAVKMTTVAAAKEELDEEDYKQLVADINAVAAAEENGAIVTAFWFSVDEDAEGEVAEAINSSDDASYLKYTFACVGAPRVYLNGKLLEVTMNEDGTYTVLLPETGSVIIVVDAAE